MKFSNRVTAIVFAAAMTLSLPLAAQVEDSRMVGGWYLAKATSERLGTDCIAVRNLPDGTRLSLSFGVGPEKRHRLEFENADWQSLNSLPYAPNGISVQIVFDGGGREPISSSFRVLNSRFWPKPGLAGSFDTQSFMTLLNGIAAARTIKVTADGRDVGTWAMDGSSAAISALLACGGAEMTEQERQQVNDPFRR